MNQDLKLTPEQEIQNFISNDFNLEIYNEIVRNWPGNTNEEKVEVFNHILHIGSTILLFTDESFKTINWIRGYISSLEPKDQQWYIAISLKVAEKRIDNNNPKFYLIKDELLKTDFDNNSNTFTDEMKDRFKYFTGDEKFKDFHALLDSEARIRGLVMTKKDIVNKFIKEHRNEVFEQLNFVTPEKNPYPRIFKNSDSFLLFESLKSEVRPRKVLADYSFIYRRMQQDGLIFKNIVDSEYRDFLANEYSVVIDKTKLLAYCTTDLKENSYSTKKGLFKHL